MKKPGGKRAQKLTTKRRKAAHKKNKSIYPRRAPIVTTSELGIYPPGFGTMLTSFAASGMVQAALIGASDKEKMLVAALIPTLLKLVRTKPRTDETTEAVSPADGCEPKKNETGLGDKTPMGFEIPQPYKRPK